MCFTLEKTWYDVLANLLGVGAVACEVVDVAWNESVNMDQDQLLRINLQPSIDNAFMLQGRTHAGTME